MRLLKFIIIMSWSIEKSIGAPSVIEMIVDIKESYEKPTDVVAKVCWTISEKRNLMLQMMNSTNSAKVLFVNHYKEIVKFDPIHIIIIFDLNCIDSADFLTEAKENLDFKEPSRWLFVTRKNETKHIPEQLLDLNIFVDSEVFVALRIDDTIVVNMIYRIDSTREFLIENYGIWSQDGFNRSEEINQAKSIRRKDLRGKPVAASLVAVDNRTKTDIYAMKDMDTDNIAKITFSHLKPLYDYLNATEIIVFTNTWGYFINRSWNGMVGDIVHGSAELCGTLTFMRLERTSVLQYMTQPIPVTPKFVFREPSLSFQNNLYRMPFKSAVWICIGGLIVLLIIIIYVNAKWERSLRKDEKKENDPTVIAPNLSDIAIFVVSAVTQQGSNSELRGSLGRVVTFLMFLIFLFLYTSYSANIVALLQSSSNQIRTLSDLLNSRLEIGVEDEIYNRHYFSTATDPIKKAIYETKVARPGSKGNFMSIQEGVERLKNKDTPFAFHMNLGMGYKKVEELFQEHEKCGLREIEYISNARPWLCCSKKSPLKEIFKIGAARVHEHGLGDRINRIFYARKPYCNIRGGSFGSVNMVDFHPVLLWLLYGMIAAVGLLILENLMYRQSQSHRND